MRLNHKADALVLRSIPQLSQVGESNSSLQTISKNEPMTINLPSCHEEADIEEKSRFRISNDMKNGDENET